MVQATSSTDSRDRLAKAKPWDYYSLDLARWVMARMVNRTDAWGGYTPLRKRGEKYTDKDGKEKPIPNSLTRPSRDKRGKVLLTEQIIRKHFQALQPELLVGLHTTSPQNTCLWCAVDVDWHGEGSTDPEVNLRGVFALYVWLISMGFRPLLIDSNGKGGFHLIIFFSRPVPTALVFRFVKWIIAHHKDHGLPAPSEVFPKQASVAPPGQRGEYGNWLRLPGMHHTNIKHWSRVWSGERWLEGEEAIQHILAIKGDDPALLPEEATNVNGSATLDKRIKAYMATLPNRSEGQGRDDIAYTFAAFMVNDMAMSDADALPYLKDWDNGNTPPKGEDRLCEILGSARNYARNAYGSGLNRNGRDKHTSSGQAEGESEPESEPIVIEMIDSAAFAGASYKPRWHVRRVLVANQPCIVGGPKKSLKTSILIDLAVSLGSGLPFLGQFDVDKATRTGFLSGESGPHTIQDTALNVCKAKGISLGDAGVWWGFTLPQLSQDDHLDALNAAIKKHSLEAIILDPLYLCLLAGNPDAKAGNLFDMGPLLARVAGTCLEAGATPVLAHHNIKRPPDPYAVPELEDLAFAGIQEFARQWLLIGRREKYELGSGQHCLWLSIGGSVGFSSCWAVDVYEGQVDDDFEGRTWDVSIQPGSDAIATRRDAKEECRQKAQDARRKSDDAKVLLAIDELTSDGGVATYTKVRRRTGFNSDKIACVVDRLVREGLIEEVFLEVVSGRGGKQDARVLRRKKPNGGIGGIGGIL
jgi:AAA domain-containing protein/TOTE conflict system primase-like protein